MIFHYWLIWNLPESAPFWIDRWAPVRARRSSRQRRCAAGSVHISERGAVSFRRLTTSYRFHPGCHASGFKKNTPPDVNSGKSDIQPPLDVMLEKETLDPGFGAHCSELGRGRWADQGDQQLKRKRNRDWGEISAPTAWCTWACGWT